MGPAALGSIEIDMISILEVDNSGCGVSDSPPALEILGNSLTYNGSIDAIVCFRTAGRGSGFGSTSVHVILVLIGGK